MPWWIWLILALAMLAVLIAGVVYVIMHGLRALQLVQQVGEEVSDRMGQMNVGETSSRSPQRPIFTEPLQVAADRYTEAHAQVDVRKRKKQERHMRIWRRWAQFNK